MFKLKGLLMAIKTVAWGQKKSQVTFFLKHDNIKNLCTRVSKGDIHNFLYHDLNITVLYL